MLIKTLGCYRQSKSWIDTFNQPWIDTWSTLYQHLGWRNSIETSVCWLLSIIVYEMNDTMLTTNLQPTVDQVSTEYLPSIDWDVDLGLSDWYVLHHDAFN